MRFHVNIFLMAIILFVSCKEKKSSLTRMSVIANYPSGSALAYLQNKVYLMGDDASFLLVTDTAFTKIDTIHLFNSMEKRIPKEVKKDPEGITVITRNDTAYLLLVGSGSAKKLRNFCWLINPLTRQTQEFSLDTFYNRLHAAGIKEINIEGITGIPGGLLLVSRGNKSYPKNHLIFTSNNFWQIQTMADIHIASIGTQQDSMSFAGVSGLDYSVRKDLLFLTVSTENTYNSYEDGTIGKSYLWIVKDLSIKKNFSGINPGKIIDLESIDPKFKNQKIESVAMIVDIKNGEEVIFVSDDDKGGSVLFKADILKEED